MKLIRKPLFNIHLTSFRKISETTNFRYKPSSMANPFAYNIDIIIQSRIAKPCVHACIKPLNNPLLLPVNPRGTEVKNSYLSELSGLMSLNSTIRRELENNTLFSQIFKKFVILEHSKIIYTLFEKPLSPKEIIPKIFECFSLGITHKNLTVNKELYKLYSEKYVSLCQHILTIVGHPLKINPKAFFALDQNIDLSHYKVLSVNNIIEFYVYHTITKTYPLTDKGFNILLVDHKNPLLSDNLNIFKCCESIKQTSQQHADILIYKLEIDCKNTIKIIPFYRDVKADYKGPSKGHFTLIPFLYADKRIAQII